jgi:hypothetical protein
VDPYIARILGTLGDADPIGVLESTPRRLDAYLVGFAEADWDRAYAPGKWTAREVLAHLADVELLLGLRLRQAVSVPDYRPESMDQDAWARRYARVSPPLALETFRALRAWNLALLTTFDLDDWGRPVLYPLAGVDSVDMMVRFLAGHDLNHLAQLARIAERA